jgi:uncharacterized RDD family membrane protein YckC
MRRESPTPSTFADLSLRSDPPSSAPPASPLTPLAGGGPSAALGAASGNAGRSRLDETPRPRLDETGTGSTGNRLRWDDTPRARNTDNDPLDLPLFEPGQPPARTPSSTPPPGRMPAAPAMTSAPAPAPSPASSTSSPLDDRPLISATLPPRPPLSVRRRTAEGTGTGTGPRPRVTPQSASSYGTTTGTTTTTTTSSSSRVTPAPRADAPSLELDFSDPSDVAGNDPGLDLSGAAEAASSASVFGRGVSADAAAADAADADADTAPLGARLLAGAIDVAFMALIELVVLHFTFRLTGLSFGDWRRLPLAPLIGFLALLHGGYLTMFTAASGQTMGKMIAKIKVVTMQGGAVPFGTAVVRACVWLATAPIAVGLIPALISNDHRALHDRFADTRVIKAA